MARVWSWVIVKRSGKNPFIKIPKNILEELDVNAPRSYVVILVENGEEAKRIAKCVEGEVVKG